MGGQIINGGRFIALYRFTNGLTPTLGATLLYTFGDQIKTDVSQDSNGVYTVTIDQIQDDEAYNTFVETEKDFATAGVEEIVYEDNAIQAPASSKQLLAIIKGGIVVGGASDGKQKVAAIPCIMDLSSGGYSQEAKKYSRPKIMLKSIALQGNITIPATYFNSIMVTAAAKQLLQSLRYGRIFFG